MKRPRPALLWFTVATLWPASACVTDRCTEFEVDALAMRAELGVHKIGGAAQLQRQPVLPLSEEAAIYAKRLKTLCQLLWEERISYAAYRVEARAAYRSYQTSRSEASSRPPPRGNSIERRSP